MLDIWNEEKREEVSTGRGARVEGRRRGGGTWGVGSNSVKGNKLQGEYHTVSHRSLSSG
jgi:hypothetical protein